MSGGTGSRAERLGIREARAAVLAAGAGFPPRFAPGPEGVESAVRALGGVQIDTISIVRRAHEHILWSRVPDPGYAAVPGLENPGGADRRIVEYWAHAAAYLPVEEWRFCIPRMERIRAAGHEWFRADPAVAAYVRDKIAAEGPLSARDFQEPMRGPKGWWDWKPAKIALEYLFHAGILACATRRNFQKVYDLAERQIPEACRGPSPSGAELSARHAERAASALGLFTREEAVYLRKDGVEGLDRALREGVESGALAEAAVEGLDGRGYYLRRGLLDPTAPGPSEAGRASGPAFDPGSGPRKSPGAASEPGRACILSPFDPFLIDRRRTARLWDFGYTIECYMPAAKRLFGYFALPILYMPPGDPGAARFAGLADAKTDRKAGVLRLLRIRLACRASVSPTGRDRGLAPAPTAPSALARAAARELARFAAFQGAGALEPGVLETDDPRLERAFRRELETAAKALAPRR